MEPYGNHQIGDQLRKTDEYGNPVHHTPGGEYGGPHVGAEHHHGAPISIPPTTDVPHHRRSGSSSSSSSEDDGQGGRRKKGIKDKVKEKLPGGHKDNQPHHEAGYGGGYGAQPEPEKKGMMDKIKEKLPGGHRN
uniref:Dehydrin-like protein Dh2 n=2 Tax=Paraboea crassifolia TaxID=104990 RepID=Q84RM3_9LAMI|nr:dehydrin-like protein Dh2 [Paraboea crassifolia]